MGKNSTLFYGCITSFYLALLLCCIPRYARESYRVEITDAQFTEYYRQFESRFLLWQKAQGLPIYEIPTITSIFTQGRGNSSPWAYNYYEFKSTPDTTCYFRKPDGIYIGDKEWSSGCVPHELGHAILYTIGHPCWGEFEHEDEKDKCVGRFK